MSYFNLLWEMTRCEWRMRDQATALGFLWTLLYPLMIFLALYWVFTTWMTGHTRHYAGFLMIGIVQYGFFSGATRYALSSLLRRRSILFNFILPREILVLSAVFSVAISYLVEFGLMLVFFVILGIHPTLTWMFLPALLVPFIAFVAGFSLLLAVCYARYPDFERIWDAFMTAGFFLTPVFYTLNAVDEHRQRLLLFNPLTHIIELTRGCVLQGQAPSLRQLLALFFLSIIMALGSYGWFKRQELKVTDYLL